MVDAEEKIKQYFRVAWINDKNNLYKRNQSHSPPPPAKWQLLISSSTNLFPEQPVEFSLQAPNNILEKNSQKNDIPQDYLFDFISNANDDLSLSEPQF